MRAELPASRRGSVLIERSAWRAGPGLVGLTQRFRGDGVRTLVTHRACLLARVEVEHGQVSFRLASGTVRAPRSFVLIVPPRSVLSVHFEGAQIVSDGLGTLSDVVSGAASLREGAPASGLTVEALAGQPLLASLDADLGQPPARVEARARLHGALSEPAPLRTVAAQVHMTADTLTRAFARAYGLRPKQYCTRARLFDAVIGLLAGAPIADAAFSSGFNDMSRFYKHFRSLLRTTPGTYARAASDAGA